MAKAMIWLTSGGFKVIEPEKAVEAWNALNGHTEPSEQQAEFLTKVRDIFIPPSYRDQAQGYKEAHGLVPEPLPDTAHMTHEGIQQGKMSALPLGDQ